jgi:hypothetical protein
MKKTVGIWVLLLSGLTSWCQSAIDKTFPVTSIQKIALEFDYPELIQVTSWDKNEVGIKGLVEINGGEHNDAFVITSVTADQTLTIKGKIPNIKDLPKSYTVYHQGKKFHFNSKAAFEKYKSEQGGSFEMTSWNHDVDIKLEIFLPKNIQTSIHSTYGMVELKGIQASKALQVLATYGGVDVAINPRVAGEIIASSDYGEIYSNLGIAFSGEGFKQGDFHKVVSNKSGSGPQLRFESKYGNVYLRKAVN